MTCRNQNGKKLTYRTCKCHWMSFWCFSASQSISQSVGRSTSWSINQISPSTKSINQINKINKVNQSNQSINENISNQTNQSIKSISEIKSIK